MKKDKPNLYEKQDILRSQIETIEAISKNSQIHILSVTIFTLKQQWLEHRVKDLIFTFDLVISVLLSTEKAPFDRNFLRSDLDRKTFGQIGKLLNEYSFDTKYFKLPDDPNDLIKKLMRTCKEINGIRTKNVHHLFDNGKSTLASVEKDSKRGGELVDRAEKLIDEIQKQIMEFTKGKEEFQGGFGDPKGH